MNCPIHRRGAGLADVVIIIFAGVLVLAGVAPLIAAAKESDKRAACGANLRLIAQHGFIYANQSTRGGQKFPRLYYNPKFADKPEVYTGADSKVSFGPDGPPPDGPKANDVSGAFYLLLKATDMKPEHFLCPEGTAAAAKGDFMMKSNFTSRANLSYSYNNPYPLSAAVSMGWKFDVTVGPEAPFAADMNPGDTKDGGPTKVSIKSDAKAMAAANSRNHAGAGQNVAYCDGHVEWQANPFCGRKRRNTAYGDNIYATHPKDVDADGKGGVTNGPSQDYEDSVMLPTYLDGPQPKAGG
jgi:prepilin-type processing-associated H-X9-DG protein